jgi:hypothetical protein
MVSSQDENRLAPEQVISLQKALTANSDELFQTILSTDPNVLRSMLKNKNLLIDHLLALLKRRDLSEDLLRTICDYEKKRTSHKLKVALVRNPNTPGPIVLSLLPHLYLFELIDVCFLPGVTPDQKMSAERTIIQRLPQIELGNKITLARRATADVVAAILKEGESRAVLSCLSNPRLREVAILQCLNSATVSAETISAIARHSKWQGRPNIRSAILKNRKTPLVWFTLYLPKIRTDELNRLASGRRLNPQQKRLVQDELKKRL